MNNNKIEAEEVNLIYQKENNPPCVRPDREDSTEREIQTAILETNETAALSVTTRSGVPKNPLTIRNMAAQPPSRKAADQVQLLEKFRKLRQWQQQQQDSMLRQQQQQMETIKMEQNKLQSILAAQKSLQEQRVKTVASQQPPYAASNLDQQNLQKENLFDDQKEQRQYSIAQLQLPLDTVTKANAESNNSETNPASLNTSSSLSFPQTVPVSRSMSSQHSRRTVVQETVDSGTLCFNQQQLQPDYSLEGSLGSFNNTMYPTMWNLPNNYNLPLGAIPLTPGTGVMPSQMLSSNPQLITDISSPNLPPSPVGTIISKNSKVSLGNQAPGGTHELDRLWKHSPRLGIDDDLESQCDNQSEADAMSGVYPLCDSESEMVENEGDDSESNESERNVGSNEKEDGLEETPYDENTTVKEINHQCPTGKNEIEEDKSTFDEDSDEARPIKPGIGGSSSARTFEELLEEQLRLDEVKASLTTTASKKACRPFLRKGQGLQRYKGKPSNAGGPSQESASQAVVPPHSRKGKKDVVPVQSKQGSQQSKVTRKVATKSPQVVVESNREPILTKRLLYESSVSSSGVTGPSQSTATAVATNTTLAVPRAELGGCTSVTNSIDASFQIKMKEWEENQELEEEELEEFELLEQAAANASFSSNSSVVVRMLTKARGEATAPDKKHVKDVAIQRVQDNRGNLLSPVDTGYGSEDGKVQLSEGTVANGHFAQQELENGSDDEDSDVTLQEMSLNSVLDLEACEDDRKRLLSNQQHVARLEEKAHSYPVSTSSLAIEEDFNDEDAWGAIKTQSGTTKSDKNKNDDSDSDGDGDDDDDDNDSDVTISDIFPLGSSTPPAHMKAIQSKTEKMLPGTPEDFVTSTPPTSALVTKLFPQLKPKQQKTVIPPQPPVTQPIDTHAPFIQEREAESSHPVHSHAVREKLKQLETEIEKFRVENAALAKTRVEREEELNKLRKEIAAFEKQKTEELERLETFREEELRKLRRERKVFERYQKAARAIPDKKEREEIESLRGQVSELQEELKRRESRWSAATTRYRQKIESLEKQNKELQDELKLLEQYRLQQWREGEQSKVKEAEDTRPKKSSLRKTIKATEEETGPRLPPSHGSPPDIPAFVESAVKSTSDAFSPDNRSTVTDENASDSKPGKINKETNSGPEILSESGQKSPKALTARIGGEGFHENHSSKRSSPRRRRSKTPDSAEKKRKNVRFEDDNRVEFGGTKEGSDLANLEGMSREREIVRTDGKMERLNSDGSRVISFANGTSKEISADGQTVTVTFFNGDVKQILPDQRVIYYYSDVQTTHTTYPDGLEVLQFPSKQIEKHYRDGTKEIIFPDQTIKYLYPNGAEECVFSDGTIQRVSVEGDRTIEFPNGQRETHTKYYKKREYPDGTVKTVYPDGRTETRYSTGRVRVKDRDGRVLVDTADQSR